MVKLLIWIATLYLLVGAFITAFCVHMSYHEAAIGFADNDDAKAQRMLEGKLGFLGFVFLILGWPLALLIAFQEGGSKDTETPEAPEVPEAPEAEGAA